MAQQSEPVVTDIESTATVQQVRTISSAQPASLGTTYFCDASGGAFAPTVRPANEIPGRVMTFKKTDSSVNAVTVTSTELIDGASTKVLTSQYDSVTIQSDGDNWHIIASV